MRIAPRPFFCETAAPTPDKIRHFSVSTTTDLIADLVRAANGDGEAAERERRRLLKLAVHRIYDLRVLAGIPSSGTAQDALGAIRFAAHAMESLSDDELKLALLKAAEMLRDLRIVIDSDVNLKLTTIEP